MSDKQLGVGIIGLGIGERHLETVNASQVAYVAGICDFDNEKLTRVGNIVPNAFRTENASQLINDPRIDVVVIASYDGDHGPQVIESLTLRKHVFVEKPVCTSREDLDAIVGLLGRSVDLRMSSNLVLRSRSRFSRLKKQIKTGYFGDIYLVEADYNYGRIQKLISGWRGTDPRYSVILGGGIHMIDIATWVTGAELTRVQTFGSSSNINGVDRRIVDTTISVFETCSGALVKIGTNFPIVGPHSHSINMFGSEKTYLTEFGVDREVFGRTAKDSKVVDNPSASKLSLQRPLFAFLVELRNPDIEPFIRLGEIVSSASAALAAQESLLAAEPKIVPKY